MQVFSLMSHKYPFLRIRYEVKKTPKSLANIFYDASRHCHYAPKKNPAAQASRGSALQGFRIEVTSQNLLTTISSKTRGSVKKEKKINEKKRLGNLEIACVTVVEV